MNRTVRILKPPLNVHCGMPAWKMNHLGQTGLAGTHLVQTVGRNQTWDPLGSLSGPSGSSPDRSGRGPPGLVPTSPVWPR